VKEKLYVPEPVWLVSSAPIFVLLSQKKLAIPYQAPLSDAFSGTTARIKAVRDGEREEERAQEDAVAR
jgi:hypothetical protein